MKHTIMLLCLAVIGAALYAAPSVAVIDFDSGDYFSEQNAAVMTSLFRNELVRSGRAEVVDRRNMDKIIDEMKFQMSDWVNPERVKRFGQMIGADNLITGNFSMLGQQLYLIAQMIDVETGRIIHSSRLTLASLDEYDRKVAGFAGEFAQKFPQENRFIGEWEVVIGNYNFNIVFMYSNICIITAKVVQDGREIVEDVNGTWSFDDNIIRINGIFRNSKIRNLNLINWVSVYTFTNSNNSAFNMLVIPPGSSNQVRVSFARTIKW